MSPDLETAPSIFSLAHKKVKYSGIEIWICSISERTSQITNQIHANNMKTNVRLSMVIIL
jgi:hypothetical protein